MALSPRCRKRHWNGTMRDRTPLLWAGVMAAASGLAAALVVVFVLDVLLGNPVGGVDLLVVPPAAAAATLLGGSLWWLLVERPGRFSDARGVAVGALVGLLAHPLAWFLYGTLGPLFLQGERSSPGVLVESTLVFAVLSFLFAGGLTLLAGAGCGVAVMRARRRH